jgi:hypothetical protein
MEPIPTEPKRLKAFARFFKGYMSISSLVVAALPIPITAFKVIPVFQQQMGIFSVYTSMFCFLLLGYIFYIRHSLAPFLFPKYFEKSGKIHSGTFRIANWDLAYKVNSYGKNVIVFFMPLLLIMASFYCVLNYHEQLDTTISSIKNDVLKSTSSNNKDFCIAVFGKARPDVDIKVINFDFILKNFQTSGYPKDAKSLMFYYLGIFLFAEAAFIFMAIKEYLQDVLGLNEMTLINGKKVGDGVD